MRIATTPTHKFIFPEEVSVDELANAEIVYGQGGEQILTKTLSDFSKDPETNSISIVLTQEETKQFAPGEALVQARVKSANGAMLASQIIIFNVKPVLNSEELWTAA